MGSRILRDRGEETVFSVASLQPAVLWMLRAKLGFGSQAARALEKSLNTENGVLPHSCLLPGAECSQVSCMLPIAVCCS